MKKFLSILMTAAMLLTLSAVAAISAYADENTVTVTVTISDHDGALVVIAEPVTVSDTDGDGALTISDALYTAHEQFYTGGASAGYATEITQYGLSLQMLWGTANGGSYGYYLNNAQAYALTDVLADGDYLQAFVYTDLVAWSDKYSFFDRYSDAVSAGDEIALTLMMVGYDENWAPVDLPVKGAEITVDGKRTGVTTDAQGNAAVTISENGTHVISAVSDTETLVKAVLVVIVTGGEEPTLATETVAATSSTAYITPTAASSSVNPASVATGSSPLWLFVVLLVAIVIVTAMFLKAKKENEH